MPRKLLSLIFLIVMLTGCANPPTATAVVGPPANATESITSSTSPQTTSGFTLTSTDVVDGGRLLVEYTCDGNRSTLPLAWSGAPAETQSYAVVMHHVAAPEEIHWYWILYNIPADVTSLPKNVSGIGTLGNNINNGLVEYSPPCSQGPGDKEYIYTVYALSAQPQITVPAEDVNRAMMLDAIKDITLAGAELHVIYARQGMEDPQAQAGQPSASQQQGDRTPPPEALAACSGKTENASCEFTDQNGSHTGACKVQQEILACAPDSDGQNIQQGKGNGQPTGGVPAYNIEQAISDKAQGMTISYDALAFMTGDLGSASFFPPGKVADFWGFQYLRDNDPSEMGHAADFLTSAAMNTLNNLTADQRAELVALATSQVDSINEYGYKRFVLIKAFDRLLSNDLPAGTTGLNKDAVKAYSAELYKLDGQISFERAQLMGKIINSLSVDQKSYFDAMVGKGMKEWNTVEEPEDIRGLDRDVKVAVMTYAADLYSWYAGSIEADVYFCPERHGTYFGSFYLKDIKAMSDPTYAIPTNLTGDLGEVMQTEVQHLRRLVEDLRTLSLADAGELKLHIEPTSIPELLERVAEAYRHQAGQNQIDLIVKIESDLPEVNIDPSRVEQILGNLVSNALRYTPQGGRIQLSAKQPFDIAQDKASGSVTVSVEDNGSGIPADVLPHIFERSFRGVESRSGDESGLGLAIAKSMMELHHGKIQVESDGAGSCFSLTFETANGEVS